MSAAIHRVSSEAERARVDAILTAAGLPLAGLDDPSTSLYVDEAAGEIVACAAVERYEDVVLLRSVATRPEWRGRGFAGRLCAEALADAARGGARTAYLLTTSAEPYFARLGFRTIPREEADPRLSRSAEWGEMCRTAVLMVRPLSN